MAVQSFSAHEFMYIEKHFILLLLTYGLLDTQYNLLLSPYCTSHWDSPQGPGLDLDTSDQPDSSDSLFD